MADLQEPLRLTPQANCLLPPPGACSSFDFPVPGAHAPGYASAAALRLKNTINEWIAGHALTADRMKRWKD